MNNDGNIIAICPIAKRLGIPKFQPYFKVKFLLRKHDVAVFSSNYELYSDISDKMMSVIAKFSDNVYQYSIDESFTQFLNYDNIINDWYEFGHLNIRKIWNEVRVPVGVGFGHTLTLAKAANHGAKKLPDSNGVCVVDDEYSRKHILQQMKLDDVWGIGEKLSRKIALLGVKTAYDLANSSPKLMRQQFGVVVERTVEELNGVKCLSWDDVKSPKKQIYSTSSTGKRIVNYNDLRKALTSHAVKVCNKVRQQNSLIKNLYIFASNSPHDERYFKKGIMYSFPMATDSVFLVASAIEHVLDSVYVEGVFYYRCGVGAIELESRDFQQQDLFLSNENPTLMNCYSEINHRFGNGTLRLGSEARNETWAMRREFLSPRWTTRWSDIPIINC